VLLPSWIDLQDDAAEHHGYGGMDKIGNVRKFDLGRAIPIARHTTTVQTFLWSGLLRPLQRKPAPMPQRQTTEEAGHDYNDFNELGPSRAAATTSVRCQADATATRFVVATVTPAPAAVSMKVSVSAACARPGALTKSGTYGARSTPVRTISATRPGTSKIAAPVRRPKQQTISCPHAAAKRW